MRCSSRPLIVTKSNLCLPNLIFGRVVWTFQLCAYIALIHKLRYQKKIGEWTPVKGFASEASVEWDRFFTRSRQHILRIW